LNDAGDQDDGCAEPDYGSDFALGGFHHEDCKALNGKGIQLIEQNRTDVEPAANDLY
jgi:hypothetical protein